MASLVDLLKKTVRGVTDQQQRERIKAARSVVRNWRRSLAKPVDETQLVRELRTAGLAAGDTVVVHSSLSSMTNLEGGAETIIAALMQTVTDRGTILMPAFTSAEDAIQRSRAGDLPDLRTQPSVNGKITRVFSTMPGVVRSSHPFSSVCAWGANAQYVTSGHALDYRIAHRDSPLGRLLELDGKILGIGTSMGTISFYHVIEDTWDGFPFVPYGTPEEVSYIDASGTQVRRAVAHYDRAKTKCRIDNDEGLAVREFMGKHLRERGILHDFRLAGASTHWLSARALYDELKALAAHGVTIYASEEEVRAYERLSKDRTRTRV